MQTRAFGSSDLRVSEVGFGAWAIGGPAMAGDTPIGWGDADDAVSVRALRAAVDHGITFFDTADFYGLGHSEELIGATFGNSDAVVVATKVGHRLASDGSILQDYSQKQILAACEQSLRRLRREAIDYYQLHSPRLKHLQDGECIEAMNRLAEQGKIRSWGISLNTFDPLPEAEFMLDNGIGSGFQLVWNIINQRAAPIIERAQREGYGVVARMPLQFGLLTGKFARDRRFDERDHRHFRLKPHVLTRALDDLEEVWPVKDRYGIDAATLSLSFVLITPGVSTVIPGIRTAEQAETNSRARVELDPADLDFLRKLYEGKLEALLDYMHDEERR